MSKIYRLKVNLPDSSVIGDEYIKEGDRYKNVRFSKSSSPVIEDAYWFSWQVEDNPDFFEEIPTPELEQEGTERIEVTELIEKDRAGSFVSSPTNRYCYFFYSDNDYKIPEEKFPAIKEAIESVLNSPEPSSTPSAPLSKGWEIVSFKVKDSTMGKFFTKRPNGLFSTDAKFFDWSEQLLIKEGYPINSVKRLSDGVVFSIGDEVRDMITDTNFTLTEFSTKDTRIFLCGVNIMNVTQRKKPSMAELQPKPKSTPPSSSTASREVLFTSEDGVGIKEDDQLWYVLINEGYALQSNPANKFDGLNSGYKYFSNEKSAQEYILLNKPCLSVKETLDWMNVYINFHMRDKVSNGFKEYVKSKQ